MDSPRPRYERHRGTPAIALGCLGARWSGDRLSCAKARQSRPCAGIAMATKLR
jgi:hypothetical protein